jgi:CRP-like cAMP-binding protein
MRDWRRGARAGWPERSGKRSMTDSTIVDYLGQLSLFRGLSRHAVGHLARGVLERELAPDEALFRKGDPGDALYVIRSGRLKVTTVDAQGKELMLNQCGPGEVIGEMSLIDSSPRSANVVAIEPTMVLVLERERFLAELGKHPSLGMDVMRNLSARLRYATTYIEKAIEWSARVAEGDYGFAIRQIQDDRDRPADAHPTDEARAAQLLAGFFRLVEGVREREDSLKREVRRLEIEIDQTRRARDVDTFTGTDFFARLKARSEELRRQRTERGPSAE